MPRSALASNMASPRNLSLGFEYDHLFMGNKDVLFASGFSDQINENVNLYLARLNYKFGGPYY